MKFSLGPIVHISILCLCYLDVVRHLAIVENAFTDFEEAFSTL
jgi:hypothetical protein